MSTKEYDLRKLKKEMDQHSAPTFIGPAGRMLELMLKGGALTKLTKEVLITQERRETMLHKVVKISALNDKGTIVSQHELTDITFVKGDAMAVLPSRILMRMMKEVEKGGAIFIEKVWAT